jgi:ribosomal protein S18 acetylase RimI-like enzyme
MQADFMRLGASDSHVLLDVADDVFDDEIDPTHAERFLLDTRNILIVALAGKRVIGQIAAVTHLHIDAPPDLYIDNLGVTPEHQRHGIATKLVNMTLDLGREMGCRAAWIATNPENIAAAKLYEKTGAVGEAMVLFSYDRD